MASTSRQLKYKIELERIYKPEIKRIFGSILQDFKVIVANTGIPPVSSEYLPVWQVSLNNHYKRVQKKFTGIVQSSKKQDEEFDEELLSLALLMWRDQQSKKQSQYIVNTTRDNMLEAIRIAREEAMNEGKVLDDKELALVATAILRKKFSSRVDHIAMTETQASSESTKFAEAEVISGLRPRIISNRFQRSNTRKRWLTVGDRRVRPIHKLANGQIRRIHDPYVVNNQFLMYPGDTSLGATVDNVANCRCISVYSFV